MNFSEIKNNLDNASLKNDAEVLRCSEFWPDEGGASYREFVLGTLKNNLVKMSDNVQNAMIQQVHNEQLCQGAETYVTSARQRNAAQEESNEQLINEANALAAKCQSSLETADKIPGDIFLMGNELSSFSVHSIEIPNY